MPNASSTRQLLWLCLSLVVSTGLGCASRDNDAPARQDRAEGVTSEAGEPGAEPKVRTRLVIAEETVQPGENQEVGLSFRIDPGWHLYWRGRNDSGMWPSVTWDVEGPATLNELRWPAPERLISPGSILDHVYENEVTLVALLTVSPDAKPGDEIVLRGDVSWVVCREACLAEGDSVELRIPVTAAAAKTPDREAAVLLGEARARLPLPLPAGVSLTRSGDRVGLALPEVAGLSFFPAQDCVDLADAVRDGNAQGDRLNLQLKDPAADARLRGVLEVRYDAPRPARYYALDLPVPAPAG